jgi:hypothetical protein
VDHDPCSIRCCSRPLAMSWRVEVWVQPTQRLLRAWCSRRCGPWRYYATCWAETWEQIPAQVDAVNSCGLYHRMLLCCEEYEGDEPCDQV